MRGRGQASVRPCLRLRTNLADAVCGLQMLGNHSQHFWSVLTGWCCLGMRVVQDFQGGSPATLFESVTKKIFEALPPTTVIHPGRWWHLSFARVVQLNIFLSGAAFGTTLTGRKHPPPDLGVEWKRPRAELEIWW
jgi:hypothetical protein